MLWGMQRKIAGGALWTLTGALLAVSVLGMASIGFLLLIPGLGLLAIAASLKAPGQWTAAVGAGAAFVAVGLINALDSTPQCTAAGTADPPQPGIPQSCQDGGGFFGELLIGLGVAAMLVAVAARLWMSRRPGEPNVANVTT